jgi:hypothetical protein
MSQSTTPNDADDRAIHAAADREKTDLSKGADVHVSDGHDGGQPPPKVDPFSARKAMFAKSDSLKARDAQSVQDDNPSVRERVQAMEAEARGDEPTAAGIPAPVDTGTPAPGVRQGEQPPSQPVDPYVTVQINGASVQVARADVERAGGEANYIRLRLADDREADLAAQAAELAQRRAKLDADEQRLTQLQVDPPPRPAASQDGSATPADLDAQADMLAAQIYSGDPTDAREAIRSILTQIAQAKPTATPEQIAALAADRIRQQTEPKPTPTPAVDPRWEAQRLAINAMAERDFPAIAQNATLSAQARAEIQRLSALPANAQRRAMDIAIEACEGVMKANALDSRSQVRELKQGLPATPSAGGTMPVAEEEPVLTGSAYVDMLAKRRRFTK